MNKPGIHRSTPNSRAGRSMISPGKYYNPSAISTEIRDWNAQVEQRKREKHERKLAKAATDGKFHRDPVHVHEGKWWFWDETWASALGPYQYEFQAREALAAYCKMLDQPIDTCNDSCPIP